MLRTMKKVKQKPKYMISYLCHKCGFDFAVTELDKSKCFYCENEKDWEIIKKQKLSIKVIADRMELVNNRLIDNLKGAYQVGKKNNDFNEDLMLETLDKAKKLKEGTRKIFKKKRS